MASIEDPARPPITHILETCLYVKNMPDAVDFYQNKLGLKPYLVAVSSEPPL